MPKNIKKTFNIVCFVFVLVILKPLFLNLLFLKNLLQYLFLLWVVTLFLTIIFGPRQKVDFNLFKKILSYFTQRKNFSIPIFYLWFSVNILAFIIANILLAIKYILGQITLERLGFYEFNILFKIFSLSGFYSFIVLVFSSFGEKILSFLKIKFSSIQERILFSWGIGIIPFMFLVFLITIIGRLYREVLIFVILSIFFLAFPQIKKNISHIRKSSFNFSWETPFSATKTIVLLLLLFSLILNFIYAIRPVFIEADSSNLYLNAPFLYLQNHRYVVLKNNGLGTMGQNIEMLYTGFAALLDFPYIIHFSFLFFLFSLWGFYLLAKKIFNEKQALLTVVLIYLMAWIFFFIYAGKVEMGLLFYSMLVFYTLFIWIEKKKNKFLYLLGIFSGITLGIKYNTVFLLVPTYLIILFFLIIQYKKNLFQILKPFILSGVFAVIFFSPWGIKNQVYYKNIFHPVSFFSFQNPVTSFGCDTNYAKKKNQEISFLNFKENKEKINKILFLLPTLKQNIFYVKTNYRMGDVGLAPLIVFPLFFLFLKNKKSRLIIFVIFVYFELWHIFPMGSRPWYAFFGNYLIVFLLPFLLLKTRWGMIAYISLTLILTLPHALTDFGQNFDYIIGKEDSQQYQARVIPFYNIAQHINKLQIKKPFKILVAESNAAYPVYNNHEILYNDLYLGQSGCALKKGEKFFLNILKKNHFKYIVINNAVYQQNFPEFKNLPLEKIKPFFREEKLLYDFCQSLNPPLYSDDYFALYQVY